MRYWELLKLNKKILGILICTMFFMASSALSLECFNDRYFENKKISNKLIDLAINLDEELYDLVNTKSSKYSTDSYFINTEWGQHGHYKSKCPWTVTRPPLSDNK